MLKFLVVLDESTVDRNVSHSISVPRTQGSFGSVTVSWSITPSDQPTDLTPISGTITYGDNQDKGTITISTLADDVSLIVKPPSPIKWYNHL